MDTGKNEMDRESLIARLNEAVKREESATGVYLKHISAIVTRSGLPEEDVAHIKRSLESLIKSNNEHKMFLVSLIERIRGEELDVY